MAGRHVVFDLVCHSVSLSPSEYNTTTDINIRPCCTWHYHRHATYHQAFFLQGKMCQQPSWGSPLRHSTPCDLIRLFVRHEKQANKGLRLYYRRCANGFECSERITVTHTSGLLVHLTDSKTKRGGPAKDYFISRKAVPIIEWLNYDQAWVRGRTSEQFRITVRRGRG